MAREEPLGPRPAEALDRFFELSGRGTTVGRELRGGVTTFMAMGAGLIAYAVVKAGRGKWGEVSPWLWPVVVLFLAYFGLEPIRELFGIGG